MTQPHSIFSPSTNTAPSTAKSISNPLKTTQDSLSKHDINALANSMGLFTEKLYGKHQPTQLSASFVPYTTSSQSTRTQFNNSPTRKGTENPVSKDKKSGLTISVDNTDFKDMLKNYKKVFPQTTKASKTPYSIGLHDKAKKGADVKTKKLSQGDENVRKKSPNRETSKGKIELKQKIIMEEPPKKSSLPQNLALSLNSLYTAGDSNSHRAIVSSRVGESANSKTTVATGNSAKANRKQPGKEDSTQVQEKPKSFGGGLLANLESMSARNVSNTKISINNINNVGTINNYIHDTNAASVRAGASHSNSHVPDFETALKEKDEEIQKLMKDKQELQGVLELLVYEINDRKQGKVGSKEKDEAIGGLMLSLIEALGGTEDNKEGVRESPNQQMVAKRRSQKGNVSQDMENVRTIVNQLKTVSSSPDRSGDKTEFRSELLETLMQNNAKEIKKSNEGKAYDLYQRSFSTTADTTIGKKKESPYGEALKAPSSKKGVKNGTMSSRAKGNGDSVNRKSMNGKGKLYMETLKTQEIDNGLIKTLPSTTKNAGGGGDMLRRKFSHDPKMVSDVISEMLAKKKSVANVENVERKVEKKEEGERLDIKTALNGLKERIAKALGSQKRLQDKIKDTVKVE